MGAPDRTTGLPIHLLYPLISATLLAIAAFASADSVWYASANSPTLTASRDGCGVVIEADGRLRFASVVLISTCNSRADCG